MIMTSKYENVVIAVLSIVLAGIATYLAYLYLTNVSDVLRDASEDSQELYYVVGEDCSANNRLVTDGNVKIPIRNFLACNEYEKYEGAVIYDKRKRELKPLPTMTYEEYVEARKKEDKSTADEL